MIFQQTLLNLPHLALDTINGLVFFCMGKVISATAGASARKESLHKACCCQGFVGRISTDVEPDQMACTSETEGEAGDRGIKTH